MARVVRLWQYGAPSGGGSVMNYRPVAGWGRLPEGWSYVEATSVAVDAADNVYVFNRGAHPVIVFDRDGNFLRSWGEGIFRRPHGITIGPNDTLWLTDDLHHTIRQFTAAGKRSEEHTSELQSLAYLVCRLLLEKKKKTQA